MGKSNKKVKSDRINALRKQYDAFLEEDKKRKERNDYILGRLDKMRYCTAVVPLRHKPTLFIDRRDNFSTSSSLTQLNKSSVDIPRHFDESTVFHEISKKYILIPKNKSNIEAENITIPTLRQEFEESGDWKRKYEILEQLKKKEKESEASVSSELCQQNNYDNLHEPHIQKYYDHKIEPQPAYKYELPEKDNEVKKCNEVQNQFKTEEESTSNALTDNQVDVQIEDPQCNFIADNVLPQNELEFTKISQKLEPHQNTPDQTESAPASDLKPSPIDENNYQNAQNPVGNYNENDNSAMASEQYTPIEIDKDTDESEKVYPEDTQSVTAIHPDDLVKQINDSIPNSTSERIESNGDYQYPIETVNDQEFTPESNVQLQDGVNINPAEYTAELSNAYALDNNNPTYEYNPCSEIIDHGENTVENTLDISGIEAFDAEQREMFYSEGTNEFAYNEENVGEAYEQEVPAQGADYAQGDGAVYYEGYDAQQAYPVENSEHEDVNQSYDPHYEQQYATNYSEQEAYNEQNYTEDPKHEGDVNRVKEGLEQFQFEQQHEYETVENIEQQLNAEQGYNEQINMSNIEKPIEDLQAMAPNPDTPK